MSRSYEQYCPVAVALDRIGDRWTLLVLRELTIGEQRFTDLRRSLPGIAPNLLAERLRSLEEHGLVEQRELPPPAARTVYALTAAGRRVRPVLLALSAFGLPYLDDPGDRPVRAAAAVLGAFASRFDPAKAGDADLVVHFDVDGEHHRLAVHEGRLTRPEPGRPADVELRASAAALVRLARDGTRLRTAAARGEVEVVAGRRHLPALERAFALDR